MGSAAGEVTLLKADADYFASRRDFEDLSACTDADLKTRLRVAQENFQFGKKHATEMDSTLLGMINLDIRMIRAELNRRRFITRNKPKAPIVMDDTFRPTDLWTSTLFANQHREHAHWCPQLGWLLWTGTTWQRDEAGDVMKLAAETVRSVYQRAAKTDNSEQRQAIAQHARKIEAAGRLQAMISLAQHQLAIRADELDKDPWQFNVQNGTINLRTGELKEHSRSDYITKISPVEFDPQAPCTVWYKFLQRIFNDDPDLIFYIQKIAGYCLTANTQEQEFYLFHGLGANGKSTFVKTLLRMMGDYGKQSPVETFLVKKNSGIPNDVARLHGARFVAAMESEANEKLAESLVKALTGGDKIAARFLHREFFEFEATFKLILSTNHKPCIVGTDVAMWRRVRLIPFSVSIPKEDQDKQLPTKLETELPGILRWAVEGCLLWQKEGLEPPTAVTGASQSYRDDMDTLGEFLDARCEKEPGATVSTKDLYAAYVDWSESQKDRERDRLKRVTFGHKLAERGFDSGRNWQGRFWRGLRLVGT
jgi:putative DNA primase/helicase